MKAVSVGDRVRGGVRAQKFVWVLINHNLLGKEFPNLLFASYISYFFSTELVSLGMHMAFDDGSNPAFDMSDSEHSFHRSMWNKVWECINILDLYNRDCVFGRGG